MTYSSIYTYTSLMTHQLADSHSPVYQYVGSVCPPEGGGFSVAGGRFLQVDHGVPEPDQSSLALQVALYLNQLMVLPGGEGGGGEEGG